MYLVRICYFFVAVNVISGCGMQDNTNQEVSKRHQNADIMTLAGVNGCTACHQIKTAFVGPAWEKVSQRYQNSPDARAYLIDRVKHGSKGSWTNTGGAEMPANSPRVSDQHIAKLVDFILSLSASPGQLKLSSGVNHDASTGR